ncbi:ALP1-like protein isoform X1 [Tanacetum coccineum]
MSRKKITGVDALTEVEMWGFIRVVDCYGKEGNSDVKKIRLYGEVFLRRPTQTDVEKLYAFHEEKHGFPGMIGSIDCTKWLWAQCPAAYRAQFSRGDSGSEPFVLLEAVASQDLWILHAFFGVAGSNNDVNVLHQSTVLNDLKVGKALEVPFVANDVNYKWGYYLTDGIYP